MGVRGDVVHRIHGEGNEGIVRYVPWHGGRGGVFQSILEIEEGGRVTV